MGVASSYKIDSSRRQRKAAAGSAEPGEVNECPPLSIGGNPIELKQQAGVAAVLLNMANACARLDQLQLSLQVRPPTLDEHTHTHWWPSTTIKPCGPLGAT